MWVEIRTYRWQKVKVVQRYVPIRRVCATRNRFPRLRGGLNTLLTELIEDKSHFKIDPKSDNLIVLDFYLMFLDPGTLDVVHRF